MELCRPGFFWFKVLQYHSLGRSLGTVFYGGRGGPPKCWLVSHLDSCHGFGAMEQQSRCESVSMGGTVCFGTRMSGCTRP